MNAIEQELRDRFGELPQAARNLLWVVRLRLLATAARVGSIGTEDEQLVVRMLPGHELERESVARRLPGARVTRHQVRLDRGALGAGWREGVVRALDAIAGAARAPEASIVE